VVEVAQDNEDTTALGAERVFNRNSDVVEGDEGGTCSRGIGGLDGFSGDAFLTGNEYNSQAILFGR
jgi:hypothetical protein